MTFAQLVRVTGEVAHGTEVEALGITIVTGMLFAAGALGALCRVVVTQTQVNWSQRTFVDMLIGGCAGILLPIFAPIINPIFGIKFESWTAIQQSVLSLMLGGSGSYFWTAIGWRKGFIVTPEQAAAGGKPVQPEQGVLKMTMEADKAVEKSNDLAQPPKPGEEEGPPHAQ